MIELSPESTSLIGEAPAFLAMLEHVSRAAGLAKPVLVIGERGTGKELIARALHALSRHHSGPFVAINCASLSCPVLLNEAYTAEKLEKQLDRAMRTFINDPLLFTVFVFHIKFP